MSFSLYSFLARAALGVLMLLPSAWAGSFVQEEYLDLSSPSSTRSGPTPPSPRYPSPLPSFSTSRPTSSYLVFQGTYTCEFNQEVALSLLPSNRVLLQWGDQSIVFYPHLTSTGTVRLEDPEGRWTWIQIANKSMLMDQQHQRRVLDGCQHAAQRFQPIESLNLFR